MAFFDARLGVEPLDYATAAANLVRLQLVMRTGANEPPYVTHLATHELLSKPVQLTQFGAALVEACRPPDEEPLTTSMMGVFTPEVAGSVTTSTRRRRSRFRSSNSVRGPGLMCYSAREEHRNEKSR